MARGKTKFLTQRWQTIPEFNRLLISSYTQFGLVSVIPKYLKFATLSEDLLLAAYIYIYICVCVCVCVCVCMCVCVFKVFVTSN